MKGAATRSGNLEEKTEEGKSETWGRRERRIGGREGKKERGSWPSSPQTEGLGETGLLEHECGDQPLGIHHRAKGGSMCFK